MKFSLSILKLTLRILGHLAMMGSLALPLDCAANMILGGSWRNTLSAEAWRQRDHKYWRWTHRAIDALFFWQQEHCRTQSEREAKYRSGLWGSWWAALQSLVKELTGKLSSGIARAEG